MYCPTCHKKYTSDDFVGGSISHVCECEDALLHDPVEEDGKGDYLYHAKRDAEAERK